LGWGLRQGLKANPAGRWLTGLGPGAGGNGSQRADEREAWDRRWAAAVETYDALLMELQGPGPAAGWVGGATWGGVPWLDRGTVPTP